MNEAQPPEVKVAGCVDCHTIDVQPSAGGRAAVAAGASTGDGPDYSARDLPNTAIECVPYIQIARGIHSNAGRTMQLGTGGQAAVAAVSRSSVARDSGNHPVRHLPDAVVNGIGDVDVA